MKVLGLSARDKIAIDAVPQPTPLGHMHYGLHCSDASNVLVTSLDREVDDHVRIYGPLASIRH